MKFTFLNLNNDPKFWVLQLTPEMTGYKNQDDVIKFGLDNYFVGYVLSLKKFKDQQLCDFWHGNRVHEFPVMLQNWHDSYVSACIKKCGFQKVGSFVPINEMTKITKSIEIDLGRYYYEDMINYAWQKLDENLKQQTGEQNESKT